MSKLQSLSGLLDLEGELTLSLDPIKCKDWIQKNNQTEISCKPWKISVSSGIFLKFDPNHNNRIALRCSHPQRLDSYTSKWNWYDFNETREFTSVVEFLKITQQTPFKETNHELFKHHIDEIIGKRNMVLSNLQNYFLKNYNLKVEE